MSKTVRKYLAVFLVTILFVTFLSGCGKKKEEPAVEETQIEDVYLDVEENAEIEEVEETVLEEESSEEVMDISLDEAVEVESEEITE